MTRMLSMLALVMAASFGRPAFSADEIQVSSVLVKLIEQVEVPAREAGVLESIAAREGQMVAAGATLAQIEDALARLERRRAQLELAGARKQAESDVKVRYAKKSLELAEAELRRAQDSQRRLAQSVSQSELDQLRIAVQQSALQVEQAELELDLAQSVRELKENEVAVAENSIRQRRIVAPLSGFVAQVHRHQGEWVQPGQTILRILRLDRLRAEGMVNAANVQGDINGRYVTLTVSIDDGPPAEYAGKVVFVSPEIDPVNGQVRIWAEIDNTDLRVRPGLRGSMTIDRAPRAAASK